MKSLSLVTQILPKILQVNDQVVETIDVVLNLRTTILHLEAHQLQRCVEPVRQLLLVILLRQRRKQQFAIGIIAQLLDDIWL